jgi:NitT/TauT family transport system ATP-binding protein
MTGAQTDLAIRARGVDRTFQTRRGSVAALQGFDLDVRRGEFLCLLGPSGCGKSTFLRMVAGLASPSAGRIDITGPRDRPMSAMVFQDYSVYPWRTVAQNVRFGLEVAGVPRRAAAERVDRWITAVGLDGFADAYPAALSGGMKQRVALARALAVEPEILLMDEPFAALDAQLRQVLQEELLRIWQGVGHTVVFITHSIDEAILLGDRVVLMTARPGRAKAEFLVPFARPRHSDLRGTAEFAALEREIWGALRDEVEAPPAAQANT